jgi:hypothetical protein
MAAPWPVSRSAKTVKAEEIEPSVTDMCSLHTNTHAPLKLRLGLLVEQGGYAERALEMG